MERQGVGFLGLLALLFIGLKLGGILHWSWLWVLAPLWLPVAALLAALAVVTVPLIIFMIRGR